MTPLRRVTEIVVLVAGFLFMHVELGYAHPGRLDADGCHHTRKEFRYETGEVIPANTYHCHRALGRLKLDSREMLQESDARGDEVEARPPEVR